MEKMLCLAFALSISACESADADCYHEEPDSTFLSFSPVVGSQAQQGTEYSVFVQFFADPGMLCNDDFDGCHCDDLGPSIQPFNVIRAECDDGSCDVVQVGPYVAYAREIRLVPKAQNVTLRVDAQQADGIPREASGTYVTTAMP